MYKQTLTELHQLLAPRPPRHLVGGEPGALRRRGLAAERLVAMRVPPEALEHACVGLELGQHFIRKHGRVGFTRMFTEEGSCAIVERDYAVVNRSVRRRRHAPRACADAMRGFDAAGVEGAYVSGGSC